MGRVSSLSQRLRRKAAAKNTLIGAAPAMLELCRQIAQLLPTNVTVLIVSEGASGKELVPLVPDQQQAIDRDWPTLAELERRYIDRVLERTGGNKTQAAAILGVARRTLQRQERDQD